MCEEIEFRILPTWNNHHNCNLHYYKEFGKPYKSRELASKARDNDPKCKEWLSIYRNKND